MNKSEKLSTKKPPSGDLRVVKTKRALASALLQLLKKSSFSKITVNDICSLALVSRTTFYLHFEDKYQLLHYCLEQLRGTFELAATENGLRPMLLEMLGQMQKNGAVFKNLLVNDLNPELVQMMAGLMTDRVREKVEQRAARGEGFGAPAEVMVQFVVGGAFSVMRGWVMGDFSLSKEQLADTMLALMEC